MMESNVPDWSLLNHDLLSLVLEKLPLHLDYLHFSVVCKSWHDVAKREIDQRIRSQARNIPFLLVPMRDGSEKERGLYNLVDNKNLNFQVSLPFNVRCCGSSHGWLLYNTKTSFIMLKPFVGSKTISLPPVKLDLDDAELEPSEEGSYYPIHVIKAVLSCDPSLYPNDFEVLVIYDGMCKLAIFRAGDEDWTPIQDHPNIRVFDDAIYHKDGFYVIDNKMGVGKIIMSECVERKAQSIEKEDGVVFIKEEDGLVTKTIDSDIFVTSYSIAMVTPRFLSKRMGVPHCSYLVELSNKELVCALRIMGRKEGEEDLSQCVTFSFGVYQLINSNQLESNMKQWIKIDTLSGDALFLGDNYSMAINVNGIIGYEKNSIYYTDNWNVLVSYGQVGPRDVGVFHLGNHSIGYHYNLDVAHRHMPPAIWVLPSLQGCKTH